MKNPRDLYKAVIQLQTENLTLKKELNELRKLKNQILAKELQSEIQYYKGIAFLAKEVDLDLQTIKNLAFEMGNNRDDLYLILASANGDKPILCCYISKKLVTKKDMDAKKVVRELAEYIGGSGGGQSFFATAGGKNMAGISKALEAAIDFIQS